MISIFNFNFNDLTLCSYANPISYNNKNNDACDAYHYQVQSDKCVQVAVDARAGHSIDDAMRRDGAHAQQYIGEAATCGSVIGRGLCGGRGW